MHSKIRKIKQDSYRELTENILPFWINKMTDLENGGFFGCISGNNEVCINAPKGAVLNTRILWTFASAYRLLDSAEYLQVAKRAKEYLLRHFFDKKFGGIYWLLDYKGNPIETKKQIYALGFGIYGLSEYYRATHDKEALDYAMELYNTIEKHSFDNEKNGYLEAFTRDWQHIEDMRLSDKDANEQKTMNTHLHILEAYTGLYRVWKNNSLKNRLENLIEIFMDRILNSSNNHLKQFFDSDWNNKSESISFGHDIEASWLLHEAALVLGDAKTLVRVEKAVPLIVAASSEGLQPDGSMAYEKNIYSGHLDTERHWWVQAETVVGFLNHFQYYDDEKSLDIALNCWNYISSNLIDREYGEWFWSILPDGSVNRRDDKAGIWKCPYHNSRACMEIQERF